MASKKKKESPTNGNFGKQEILQAVVLADDFDYDLKPAAQIYPGIMIPVITAPLFEYVLETLERSKVQQVFVYCSSHVEKMKSYLQSVRYQKRNLTITPIINDGCRSLGDALRDLDTKGIIRGDFILLRGTAFTNVDLKSLMDLHKTKKQKDKNAALTMVFKDLGNVKDSVFKNESSFVVYNTNTKKLLSHRKFIYDKTIDFESEWFLNGKTSIRSALLDTRIYLCSQSLLPLFADNFDFQTMDDFIHGALINEEFMDARIYWESLPMSSYALPIVSWKAYKLLCKDILLRYSYPLVPDTLPISLRDFIYMTRSTYKHQTSILLSGCTLLSQSIIGAKSILGKNSHVDKSIIGPECTIGTNVCINNSIIISNVTIEDNCNIDGCIIFSNCTIETNKKLKSCILMPEVKCKADYNDTLIEIDDDGSLSCKKLEQCTEKCDFNFSKFFTDHDSEDQSDIDDDASSTSSRSTWSSPSENEPELQDDNETFLNEVIESLSRGYQDKLKCENLILEINSSRYAYNINIQQVSFNVIKAILKLPLTDNQSTADLKNKYPEQHRTLREMLKYFKPIIANYIKTEDAQEDCLRAIQDVAFTDKEYIVPFSPNLLHFFYDNDILSEEKILEWYEQDCCDDENAYFSDKENDDLNQERKQSTIKDLKKKLSDFIKWLKEGEEDSSDEE